MLKISRKRIRSTPNAVYSLETAGGGDTPKDVKSKKTPKSGQSIRDSKRKNVNRSIVWKERATRNEKNQMKEKGARPQCDTKIKTGGANLMKDPKGKKNTKNTTKIVCEPKNRSEKEMGTQLCKDKGQRLAGGTTLGTGQWD